MELKHPFSAVVVGKQGQGKSTLIKNFIKNYPKKAVIIYDPNNEYPENYIRIFDRKELLKALRIKKNKLFVIEEATGFLLNTKQVQEIIDLLIRMRHTNNAVIFVFHSIRSVPVSIFDFIQYAFIFKTNDRPELIKQKYKGVFSEKDLKKIANLERFHFCVFEF
jgi:ABC-type cobalamin/Fe3+-siderophores transport system ATPase subunit